MGMACNYTTFVSLTWNSSNVINFINIKKTCALCHDLLGILHFFVVVVVSLAFNDWLFSPAQTLGILNKDGKVLCRWWPEFSTWEPLNRKRHSTPVNYHLTSLKLFGTHSALLICMTYLKLQARTGRNSHANGKANESLVVTMWT